MQEGWRKIIHKGNWPTVGRRFDGTPLLPRAELLQEERAALALRFDSTGRIQSRVTAARKYGLSLGKFTQLECRAGSWMVDHVWMAAFGFPLTCIARQDLAAYAGYLATEMIQGQVFREIALGCLTPGLPARHVVEGIVCDADWDNWDVSPRGDGEPLSGFLRPLAGKRVRVTVEVLE